MKIYALLTVPIGQRPTTGWPVVVFNHGYIPPEQYQTTERYVAYVDAFAKAGYIVFKPDYRGHGRLLFAGLYSRCSQRRCVDKKILGGNLTLRSMMITKDIKADFVKDISGPVELHHGEADQEVPVFFSQSLFNDLKKADKIAELYTYPGADHNIGGSSFDLAMQRSVEFFDKYLK